MSSSTLTRGSPSSPSWQLRARLRQGKIYRPEKVEQALSNFFREANLSTLRELALRAVADEVGEKAASYRQREGLEPALIPERVMVCMSSNAEAARVIRPGARIAGRLGATVVRVRADRPADGLIAFAKREGITHVIGRGTGIEVVPRRAGYFATKWFPLLTSSCVILPFSPSPVPSEAAPSSTKPIHTASATVRCASCSQTGASNATLAKPSAI